VPVADEHCEAARAVRERTPRSRKRGLCQTVRSKSASQLLPGRTTLRIITIQRFAWSASVAHQAAVAAAERDEAAPGYSSALGARKCDWERDVTVGGRDVRETSPAFCAVTECRPQRR